jgi:hypothetical protein
MYNTGKSRIKLDLNPPAEEPVFVSIGKVADLKKWLNDTLQKGEEPL